MVAGVIDDEKGLPEKILAVAMRKGRIDIFRSLVQQPDKCFSVGDGLFDRSPEPACILRHPPLWPIAFGPLRALMFRAAAEPEDIPLRDPDVFRQLPDAIRQAARDFAQVPVGKIGHGLFI